VVHRARRRSGNYPALVLAKAVLSVGRGEMFNLYEHGTIRPRGWNDHVCGLSLLRALLLVAVGAPTATGSATSKRKKVTNRKRKA
jgi:hypothetical protein